MDKLKPTESNTVTGDAFFNREVECKILSEKIENGDHLLLTGQRRMGKSSIAREIGRALTDKAKEPFFEIFAVSELAPLKRKEAARLWNMFTQSNKTEDEVAPLIILTGASPRLLTIIAQFGKNNGIRELMENITSLIDEYTEYFKSQLDALASKERRVFLALADLWSESTAKEIAERARMDIRPTSSLLGRLEHKGALKVNQISPGRKTYLVAERLFCIYYKLRREHCQEAVIEALVQFMVDFYTPLEINTIRDLHSDHNKLGKDEAIVLTKLMSSYKEKETSFSEVNSIVTRDSLETSRKTVNTLINESKFYHQQGEPDKELAGYQQLISRYEDRDEPAIIALVAQAMINKSNSLAIKQQWTKSTDSYGSTLSYLSDKNMPDSEIYISTAMLGKDLSKVAKTLSSTRQTALVKVISEATMQPSSEERMTLAMGIAAVFSVEKALAIIQNNSAHEVLKPIIIALQLEQGEKVRTSEELLEVADDVRKRLEKMRKEFLLSTDK